MRSSASDPNINLLAAQTQLVPEYNLISTYQFQNWFFRVMVKMVKEKPTKKKTEEVYPKIEVIG